MQVAMSKAMNCIALGALVTAAHAGPLDPPPGPVEPTMKTLEVVEPRIPVNLETAAPTEGNKAKDYTYEISAPGSYYLTGNLTPAKGKQTILISADSVTLDLNGFTVFGQTDDIGISDSAAILIFGLNSVIQNGIVRDSYADGISAQAGAMTIRNITAWENGNVGINAPSGGLVTDCSVYKSLVGIGIDDGKVINCLAQGNEAGYLLDGSAIESSFARGNDVGINAQHSSILSCEVTGSEFGILATSSRIRSCLIEDTNIAVNVGGGSIKDCTINDAAQGIFVNDGGSAISNDIDFALVGIRVEGVGAYVADNQIFNSELGGIRSEFGGGIIIRNVVVNSLISYDLQGVNTVGPILPLGATPENPWANFEVPIQK